MGVASSYCIGNMCQNYALISNTNSKFLSLCIVNRSKNKGMVQLILLNVFGRGEEN
jgi:hypothetical protein